MQKIFDFKTLIAIIGIAIPIVIFSITKKTKELSFKNIAINELVSEKDIKDESISVFFDKKRIFNLYSVSSVLSNSGNVPILKADLINGLEISFPDSVYILKYSIVKNPNKIMITDTSVNKSVFTILPDLLNPNESVELNFYISSKLKSLLPYSNSRIVGGELINLSIKDEIKPKTNFNNNLFGSFEGLIFWIALVYSFIYIILFLYSAYFTEQAGAKSPLGRFFIFLFLSFGLFCTIFYLIQTRF